MKNVGDGRRVAKAEKEVQQLVAQFLIKGFKHPLPGLVTVSRVKMPGDLRSARVFVSVLGEPGDRDLALEILQDNARDIQAHVSKNLPMRYCPVLHFHADESTEHMLKMDRILRDLEAERLAKEAPAGVSSTDLETEDVSDSDDSADSDGSSKE